MQNLHDACCITISERTIEMPVLGLEACQHLPSTLVVIVRLGVESPARDACLLIWLDSQLPGSSVTICPAARCSSRHWQVVTRSLFLVDSTIPRVQSRQQDPLSHPTIRHHHQHFLTYLTVRIDAAFRHLLHVQTTSILAWLHPDYVTRPTVESPSRAFGHCESGTRRAILDIHVNI